MTNAPWQSFQTVESQGQVPTGAAGGPVIQGSSKTRHPSGSVSSSRKTKLPMRGGVQYEGQRKRNKLRGHDS